MGGDVAAACCSVRAVVKTLFDHPLNPATRLNAYTVPVEEAFGVIAAPPGVAETSKALAVRPVAMT